MAMVGTRIEETGTLLRDAGGFSLRRDLGGRWRLDFHRVPVDHIERRVRITGIVVSEDLVDVDGVAPENITSSPRAAGLGRVDCLSSEHLAQIAA
jgi:hypothetical protein